MLAQTILPKIQEIAENIAALTKLITDRGIECSVSKILKRNNYLSLVGEEVNCILRNILPDNVKLICNDSIGHNHLNGSGVGALEQERDWGFGI